MHFEYCSHSEIRRGQRPLSKLHMDGGGMQSLFNSPAHRRLREAIRAATSNQIMVFVAFEPSMLRRLTGAKLRTTLRTVVLPIASERYGTLAPQMMVQNDPAEYNFPQHYNNDDDDDEKKPKYSPVYDNDQTAVVPYLVSFFFTYHSTLDRDTCDGRPLRISALTRSDDCEAGARLVCLLEPTNFDREDYRATHVAISVIAEQYLIPHFCAACGVVVDGRLKCALCKHARYCGKACQRAHWSTGGHREGCAGRVIVIEEVE